MLFPSINLKINRIFPRHAVVFAKNHFKIKELICAEIGTYKGEHAESILKELNVKLIYLIDPFIPDYDDDDGSSKTMQGVEEIARKRFFNNNKVIFYKELSKEGINKLPLVDFIYIDGDHRYESVKKDLELCWKKVKDGGIMAGHDTNIWGVAKALAEFAEINNIDFIFKGEDWWIVK